MNIVSVVQLAVVQEDMEDESETKQNLLYVLLLKEYITYFEMLLIDKGIFIRQLFMHVWPCMNNCNFSMQCNFSIIFNA